MLRPAVLVALLLVPPAAAQDDVLFPFPLYATGGKPTGLTIGDVDLDGVHDIVGTAEFHSGDTIFVLLARGAGVFEPAHASTSADSPAAPLLADLDGDGRPDLLTTSSGGLAVQRGQGDGDFEAPVLHAAGGAVLGLFLADMDEDGALDALSVLPADDRFTLLRGDGSGGLLAATTFGVFDTPVHLAVADLDLDGHLDVVTANSEFPSTLTVRLGDGAGSVGPKNTFLADDNQQFGAHFVAADDLDGDGLPDLTVDIVGSWAPDLNTLRNLGGGTFATPVSQGGAAYAGLMADLDGDGRRDLLGAGYFNTTSFTVRLADGLGGYGPALASLSAAPASAWAAADLDGDGTLDLAGTHSVAHLVSVLHGLGDGHFPSPPQVPVGADAGLGFALELLDADLDGDTDVLSLVGQFTGQPGDDLVSVLRWDSGAGDLLPPLLSPFDADPAVSVRDAVFGDLDGDGAADALVAMRRQSTAESLLRPLRNDGSGLFSAQPETAIPDGWNLRVVLGDIDGDGDLDAVAAATTGNDLLVPCLNAGSGVFAAGVELAYTHSTADLLLHDVDLDGLADLVWLTGQCCSTFSQVRLSDGTGGFGPPIFPSMPVVSAARAAAGDVDGDGLPDLCRTGIGWETLLGLGSGNFDYAFQTYEGAGGLGRLADLDLDGDLDASLASGDAAGHAVMLGDGTGAFSPAGSYHALALHAGPRVADLDADGVPEVVLLGGTPQLAIARAERLPPGPWSDVGQALPGTGGPPRLQGHGPLVGGEPVTLKIGDAKPAASAVLVLGSSALNAPFKGGTLVPQPTLLVVGLPLDAFGHFVGSGPWYAGLPPGTETWFQAWIADSAGPKGFSATNALRATSP